MNTFDTKERVQGMKVIPTGERKCIWMEAGVVSYKLCTNQFQCNLCEFDQAMSNRARQSKSETREYKPIPGHKKEIVEWMEEFRQFPADQRKCRYMLMGEVSYKICPNSFRCGECSFDQMMQDRTQPALETDIRELPQVAGFYMDENLHYFRNHTWLRPERNGQYRVGIDDFASRMIGETLMVKLPSIGEYLDMGELCWVMRHPYDDLKFVSPLKGVVTHTNQMLLENPALISEQPYSQGWIMTVEPESIAKSNRNFLTGKDASAWMIEEANLLSKHLHDDAGVTMHDGASIASDLKKHLNKEKWTKIVKNHLYVL